MRLAPEEVLHRLDDLGHAGHAADQDHLVDLGGPESGILERGSARLDRLLDEIVHQRLKLGPGDLDIEMLWTGLVGGNEGQVYLSLQRAGELDLRLFRRLLEALQRQPVAAQIDAVLLLELIGQVIDDAFVEVLAAEEGIAIDSLNLEYPIPDFQDGNVERATAKVIDGDGAGALLLEPVGQRSRGRLVDDAQDLEPGDAAGIFGGLALGVVEVGRNRDDGLGDLLAQIVFGRLLHLLQDEGADLGRRIFLAV